MSLLVLGLSHHSGSVDLLERAALSPDQVVKSLADLRDASFVHESLVLGTCNRVEVYVEVDRFHPVVAEVTEVLSRTSGVDRDELAAHLYVHYEERAVQHLFTVATGLDSMVVGETQILGQLRRAYALAAEHGTAGRMLHELFQSALRTGKRAHAETEIDRAGVSLVALALSSAERAVGVPLSQVRVVLVGAGSMGSLVAATLQRQSVTDVTLLNRTPATAERLAAGFGADARVLPMSALTDAVAQADVLITVVGAGVLLRPADLPTGRHLVIVDLALPRDVDPAVGQLPGVTVIDLASLQPRVTAETVAAELDGVRQIVADEMLAFQSWQLGVRVTPTVVALRDRAAQVVEAELARLDGRLPTLDDGTRDEVRAAVHRVVDKLLHTPTIRVKQLAAGPAGPIYAQALHELFDLDPAAPEAVATPTGLDGL